jgi:hypothetical protein
VFVPGIGSKVSELHPNTTITFSNTAMTLNLRSFIPYIFSACVSDRQCAAQGQIVSQRRAGTTTTDDNNVFHYFLYIIFVINIKP